MLNYRSCLYKQIRLTIFSGLCGVWPLSCSSHSRSDLFHEEVDARIDLEVLQALDLALDAHEETTEAHVNGAKKGESIYHNQKALTFASLLRPTGT